MTQMMGDDPPCIWPNIRADIQLSREQQGRIQKALTAAIRAEFQTPDTLRKDFEVREFVFSDDDDGDFWMGWLGNK